METTCSLQVHCGRWLRGERIWVSACHKSQREQGLHLFLPLRECLHATADVRVPLELHHVAIWLHDGQCRNPGHLVAFGRGLTPRCIEWNRKPRRVLGEGALEAGLVP